MFMAELAAKYQGAEMRFPSWPRRGLPVVLAYLLLSIPATARAVQDPQTSATIRVVRVAAGPRGTESGGEFRLDEERTTFNRATDTQVIVSFRWEGAPGMHRMAGRWRAPNGGVSISEFEYTARDRLFGAYWSLPITPSSPVGTWTLEATVDGLPSGTLTFEISDTAVVPDGTRRRPLAQSELFDRVSSVFVTIERSTQRGGTIGRTAGFLFVPGHIATTFMAVDAADGLRLLMPAGQREDISSLIAWNQTQDWALLPTATTQSTPLPIAPQIAKVGDRCYSMETGTGATRLLAECEFVGRSNSPAAGNLQLIARFSSGFGAPGAPVLNEFGEVVGMISGALTSRGAVAGDPFGDILATRGDLKGVAVVLASAVHPPAAATPVSISDLRRQNVLLTPVSRPENVVVSGFAHSVDQGTKQPIDQRATFSPRDDHFVAFLEWQPKERLRGGLVCRIYDSTGQLLSQSKHGKIDFKPGPALRTSEWELSVPSQPGSYRIEVSLDDVTVWRGFIQVTP
jgi:hypothetical protein